MLIIDRMIVGGIKFVLGKVAVAVDQEMNDDSALREQLLAAQMQVELGEMSQEDFAELEAAVLEHMRSIRERREGGPRGAIEFSSGGAEAEFVGDAMGDHTPEE